MSHNEFEYIGPRNVRSSRGFILRRGKDFEMIYEEGRRRMVFGSEPGISRWFFFLREPKWQPPHDAEPISEADQERIIWNIADALRFQKAAFCLETARGNIYESTYRD